MNKDLHDLVQVGFVNTTAVMVSMTDIETGLRILSLVLACAYTAAKLIQLLKSKRDDE